MSMNFKQLKAATAIAVLLSSATSAAMADSNLLDNQVVRDSNGHIVKSIRHGTCVRTMWETPNNLNPCAPPAPPKKMVQAPKPVMVPSPARTLKRAEKEVYFDFDSAQLDATDRQRLDSLAEKLKSSRDLREVEIVGHADRIGSEQYNVKLSEKRAQAVQGYLADRGYINTRVAEVRGVGEQGSKTQCDGSKVTGQLISCLQPDRRVHVEMKFMDDVKTSNYMPRSYR